jgi:hypothetical protein
MQALHFKIVNLQDFLTKTYVAKERDKDTRLSGLAM